MPTDLQRSMPATKKVISCRVNGETTRTKERRSTWNSWYAQAAMMNAAEGMESPKLGIAAKH